MNIRKLVERKLFDESDVVHSVATKLYNAMNKKGAHNIELRHVKSLFGGGPNVGDHKAVNDHVHKTTGVDILNWPEGTEDALKRHGVTDHEISRIS